MLRRLNQRGFTLVEIMIVVAIIGLLAAIAIPNLLRARMNANEGAIKLDLKAFSSANESYRAAQTTPAYATAVGDLTGAAPPYLDVSWDSNVKHGFDLTYSVSDPTYGMFAAAQANQAVNDYCVDHTGIVYVGGAGPAGGCTGTPVS